MVAIDYKKFYFGKVLGKGATGYVYEGILDETKDKVAVKIIEKKLLGKGVIKRIRNEISIHQGLIHPNILRFYVYHEDLEYFYLISECCPRGELYSYVKKVIKRPLIEFECFYYLSGLLEGISYLHELGIAHRDLKLSNILLSSDYQVKIADFGLAVEIEKISHEIPTLCGTPNYLSPEILSKQQYGLSVDIWSLGVIIYTLLVGKAPFEGSNIKETLQNIIYKNCSIPDHISAEAQDLMINLLQKEPTKRFTVHQIKNHSFIKRESFNHLLKYSNSNHLGIFDCNFLLVLTIPKFDMDGLKPAVYNTQAGRLEIQPNKAVCFTFKNSTDQIVIEADQVLLKNVKFSFNYSRENVPFPLICVLNYISKLLITLQTKSPKIILQLPMTTCYLMFNQPTAAMKVKFNHSNRIQVNYFPEARSMKITKTDDHRNKSTYVLELDSLSSNKNISVKVLKLVKQVLHLYSLCQDFDQNFKAEEKYPLIYKYQQEKLQDSRHDDMNFLSRNLSITLPKSIEKKIEDSLNILNHSYNAFSMISASSESLHQSNTEKIKTPPIKARANSLHTMLKVERVSDTDIHGQYTVVFNDHSTLIIDSQSSLCQYTSLSANVTREWKVIDEHLPSNIKARLALFYQFVQKYK